jgi:hypothetical protein
VGVRVGELVGSGVGELGTAVELLVGAGVGSGEAVAAGVALAVGLLVAVAVTPKACVTDVTDSVALAGGSAVSGRPHALPMMPKQSAIAARIPKPGLIPSIRPYLLVLD